MQSTAELEWWKEILRIEERNMRTPRSPKDYFVAKHECEFAKRQIARLEIKRDYKK